MDRAAFREMGEELGWYKIDPDIMAQAGEGGVESRSTCSYDTVIAFHHKGFVHEIDAARKVLDANMDEEWTTEPSPHLPWSPCRVNPRNIVLQARERVLEDGVTIEHYLKPRVTSNTSYLRRR